MEAAVNGLKDMPIWTILIVAALLFFLLALVEQVREIKISPTRQKWAAGLGAVLLILGLVLYVVANLQNGITTATATATPTLPLSSSEPSAAPSEMNCENVEDFSNQAVDWELYRNASPSQNGGNTFLRFTPPAENDAEAAHRMDSAELAGYDAIRVRINTHGAPLGSSDESALYLDQDGWKFVALADYAVTKNEWQSITIPLSDFEGFNKTAAFARFGFRFWAPTPSTIDIDDIEFCK